MKFKLEVTMDNAAFEDPTELARILDVVKSQSLAFKSGRCLDYNGNVVGEWRFE